MTKWKVTLHIFIKKLLLHCKGHSISITMMVNKFLSTNNINNRINIIIMGLHSHSSNNNHIISSNSNITMMGHSNSNHSNEATIVFMERHHNSYNKNLLKLIQIRIMHLLKDS